MRTKQSFYNISAGIGSQIIITLLSFVSRTVFINSLGVEYLGINGLFTNILGMLSLAEAGIGSSIIYALYKPVADNDTNKINMLMRLYRNAFRAIALVIFIIGVALIPFLNSIVGETTIPNIKIIFFIFLISTSSSYLFSYKVSLLNVAQKGYISTGIYSISSILSALVKIAILKYTNNYIFYLIADVIITVTTSILLSLFVNKIYPYLKIPTLSKLDNETKSGIIKNMKALILHQIGSYAVFGTDNIIISTFVGVAAVGLYSNYYMLINICRTFINQIFDNIIHSLGNLVATEEKNKIYNIFKITMFFNFWIYSFFSILLFITLDPFIRIWLGTDFLLGRLVLIIVMINFYVTGMRRSINMVKQTSGIYHEDRYASFVEAIINLIFSIVLVKYLGMAGVFIGTLISTLTVPFWVAPYLVYKKVFERSLFYYFIDYLKFFIVGLTVCLLTVLVSSTIDIQSILGLCLKGLIALVIPNLIYVLIFRKTKEFSYLLTVVSNLLNLLLSKIRSKKLIKKENTLTDN
ncbi:lipopolysaccharide biosynthesis protein [Paenibacillus sp. WC2504]|uniref:lipopolysaccharide biosynthesis protein n=1 Tax=Paenibacillus sp. WC2504 TaxID=3461403 RepID=UPI0040467BEE